MNQTILNSTEALKEKIQEIDALSDYYDEIFSTTTKDNLVLAKEKMKYIRSQILKKTFEVKNVLRKMQLEEKLKKKK